MSELEISSKQEPAPVSNNIVLDVKFFLNKNYKFKRNVITRAVELKGKPLDNHALNSIYIRCKTNFPKVSKDIVTSIIYSDFVSDYNPFEDIFHKYNKNKPNNCYDHINTIISSIETDTPNARVFIKKWLVSIIASIHGQHSPLMLVLCGGQNTGKTEWFRRLLPKALNQYYAESKLDAGKDDEILMTKKLIIMDDEMGGKSKSEEKKLKEMTSKQTFSIRPPYGTVSEDLQRLAMLCGTTNAHEILNDPTGNRRILPVNVITINHTLYNSVNKEHLLYECYLEYKNGYNYNLTNEEIELLKEGSEFFRVSIPEEELVSKYYGLPDEYPGYTFVEKTNSEIVSYIFSHTNTRISGTKLGIILKKMGFFQQVKKVNNVSIRVYNVVEKAVLTVKIDENHPAF